MSPTASVHVEDDSPLPIPASVIAASMGEVLPFVPPGAAGTATIRLWSQWSASWPQTASQDQCGGPRCQPSSEQVVDPLREYRPTRHAMQCARLVPPASAVNVFAGHGAQSGLEGGIVGGGALVLGASEGIEVGAVGLKVG